MNNILFSVLIANYNNGRYLQEAIDSVLAQTYTNWEIILVDDKSTDNSFEIYDKYKDDNRFHIYYNAENKGCGYTKRRCAELANGEICGFLDPDDTLQEEALESMVKEHCQNADVSMVYSRYYFVDNQLNIIGISEHQCELPKGVSFLEYGRGAVSQFVSYKKSFYDLTEGINAQYKRAIDHDLYFLLEEVGKVRFIDKPLYCYRANTGHNISTNENSETAFLWDLFVMADACKRRGISIEKNVFPVLENSIKEKCNDSFRRGESQIRETKAFRIGKKITCFVNWLRF